MRRITRGFDPACSPDGLQIAFAASTSDDTEFPSYLFVVNIDGSDEEQLTFGNDIVRLPSWSPDGRVIAFSTAIGIGLVNVITKEVTHPFEYNKPWGTSTPAWSTDIFEITFFANISDSTGNFIVEGLYTSKPDGTNMRKLTGAWDHGPDWSPDGKKIIFIHQESGDSPYFFRIVGTDGAFIRDIDLDLLGLSNPSNPKWSPDGQKILFTADRLVRTFLGEAYRFAVFSVNADGTGLSIIRDAKSDTLGSEYGRFPPLPRGVNFGNVDWCEIK